jgi:iron complex outermembrane receptor protein
MPLRGRLFLIGCAGALSVPAYGQSVAGQSDASAAASPDIIVTAERRPEKIERTPIAISAFDQRFISRRKIDTVKDIIDYTPGFAGNSADSYLDGVAIRGIVSNDYGIGGDPSVAIFKDGIHQGRAGSAITSLFDIERAEALRGPQVFLFGRNAISGAISIITQKPILGSADGHLFLGSGSSDRIEGEVAINLPAGDHWAFRAAGYHVENAGWVDNFFTPGVDDRIMGQSKWAGRLSALYEDGPLRITAIGEYERRDLDGTPYRASNADRAVFDAIDAALGTRISIGGSRGDVDSDLTDPHDRGRIWGGTLQGDLDLGFATLTALGGYRQHRFSYSEDYDGTPLLIDTYIQRQRGNYASGELRLVSPGDRRLTWSVGVSAYREKVRASYLNQADETFVCVAGFGYASCDDLTQDLYGISYNPAPGGVLDDVSLARSINTGLSAYADAGLAVTPSLQVGAGLRYTWDRKRFGIDVPQSASTLGNIWTITYFTDGLLTQARSWSGATPRVYARYALSDGLSVYASATRGTKAGGFGSFTVESSGPLDTYALVPPGTRPDTFAPETIWSEEIGIKGNVFGRRLSFDLTGFHYVYRNLQSVYFDPTTRTQQVSNIGRVVGYGIEASASVRPNRYFDVYGNLAYTHTRKTGDRGCVASDCGGLPNPIWASSGVATGHLPLEQGEAVLAVEWKYQGRTRPSFDSRGIVRREGYTEANLRLGYRARAGWEIEAYVQNLFDTFHFNGVQDNGALIPSTEWGVVQPRNFGLSLRWFFH